MATVTFADDVDSGRDALTGAPLGDPVVAVRVGIAAAIALVIARAGLIAILSVWRERPLQDWSSEWQLDFANGLPLGAALTVMAWRDRPGRPLSLRVGEAALLALVAHVATESWAIFNLKIPGVTFAKSSWWWLLTTDFETRLPKIFGEALGLVFAARQRGRHVVGLALALPDEIGTCLAQVVWWPQFFNPGTALLHSVLITAVAPLAERTALRFATSVRQPSP